MRIIQVKLLTEFASSHANLSQAISVFVDVVKKAEWNNFNELKTAHQTASIIQGGRIVFNIKWNKARVVCKVNFIKKVVEVRFVGTHEEYDRINVNSI